MPVELARPNETRTRHKCQAKMDNSKNALKRLLSHMLWDNSNKNKNTVENQEHASSKDLFKKGWTMEHAWQLFGEEDEETQTRQTKRTKSEARMKHQIRHTDPTQNRFGRQRLKVSPCMVLRQKNAGNDKGDQDRTKD